MKTDSFAKEILDFYFNLPKKVDLPENVELIYPFDNVATQEIMKSFFHKYYDDNKPRTYLIGINPGRFGSGVTGVGFADAYHLEEFCDIQNDLDKRIEISAAFMFEVIKAYGGVEKFYSDFFFTTVMPLGLLKNSKNYNYYDDKETQETLESFITETLLHQMQMAQAKSNVICIGTGKNLKYLEAFNKKHNCFENIKVVPHPRWVMQYRRKEKEKHIQEYLEILKEVNSMK